MLGNACGLVQREQCYLQGVKGWEELLTPVVLLNETVTNEKIKKRERHIPQPWRQSWELPTSFSAVCLKQQKCILCLPNGVCTLALGTMPVCWGRKGHYTQFSVSPFPCCLWQMHPKWKKRVVPIKIHPLFFLFSPLCHFCGLFAICTPLSLQKQQ